MRWTRNLLVRLLAPYLFALIAVAAGLYVYSDRVVETLYLDTLSDTLLWQARLAGEQLPWNVRGSAMDQRCAVVAADLGARVTVIAVDGTVIGDSEAPSSGLENHGNRPEVQAALRDGDGRAVRVSATLYRALFYRAWRQARPGGTDTESRVIRTAVPMTTIEQARHRIRVALWGAVAVAALAAFWPAWTLSRRLSRRVARLTEFSTAVTAGGHPSPLSPEGDDVIAQLEANLFSIARSLSTQLQAAQEEKGKLEAVLRGMLEGVLVIDRSGTIRLANQCADRMFGGSPTATLVGQPLINVSRDPDLRELVSQVTRDTSGRPIVREITLPQAAAGDTLLVTATPMTASDGEPQLSILVFHDVTDLKRLEAARRDLVANVSHELRTPLTAIRGYAETLSAGAINDPELAPKFLGVIERHSERLTRLIDDLLTLSDLELGRAALRRAAITLAPAVNAAIDVVRDKAAKGSVEIRQDLPADLPPLYGDPDRIEQVLVNLIDNAVKYTPAGGQVTVSARVADTPERGAFSLPEPDQPHGRSVEVCVADTGIGIPQRDLPRLTERFYRVDKARSRELGGTGLGLAIVKHIVQAHGGALSIESEVGRGTRVHVYLPLAEAAG